MGFSRHGSARFGGLRITSFANTAICALGSGTAYIQARSTYNLSLACAIWVWPRPGPPVLAQAPHRLCRRVRAPPLPHQRARHEGARLHAPRRGNLAAHLAGHHRRPDQARRPGAGFRPARMQAAPNLPDAGFSRPIPGPTSSGEAKLTPRGSRCVRGAVGQRRTRRRL